MSLKNPGTKRIATSALAIVLNAACGWVAVCGQSAKAGQLFEWATTGGGSWFAPANWTPGGIPSTDSDTATIGGLTPILIEVAGANATVGTLNLTNPAAELRLQSGTMLTVAIKSTLNGTVSVGESVPGTFTQLRLNTVTSGAVAGTGKVQLRAPADNPSLARLLVSSPRTATWSKDITIEGTGSLVGAHNIPGVLKANDVTGGQLEFRGATIDGLGTGTYIADGAVLKVVQSTVSNARLETRNGGRIELSAPTQDGNASKILLNKAVLRGHVRSILNKPIIQDTNFEGTLEVPAGTSVSFLGDARVMNMTAYIGGTVGASASVWLGTGTPSGGGTIVLNAISSPNEAAFGGDGLELGDAWTVRGHGLIGGNIFIRNTVAVEGPSTCPLLFQSGTVDGDGTLEARGGVLEFGDSSLVRNVRLLATQGGRTRVSKSGTWTAVNATTPIEVTGGELKLVNTSIEGDVGIKGASLRIGAPAVTIDGDIVLEPGTTSSVSYLRSDANALLDGSGRLELRSFSSVFWAGIDSPQLLTIAATRSIHGAGVLAGTLKILGPIHGDDTTGVGLVLSGNVSGDGTNTIEISTGEVAIAKVGSSSDPVFCSNFRVTGQPESKPLRIGNGNFDPHADARVALTGMDIDTRVTMSERFVDLTASTFRQRLEITSATNCRVFSGCRFDGDIVLMQSAEGSGPVLELRNTSLVANRIVFANRRSDEFGAILYSQSGPGVVSAKIVGTGRISVPHTLSGVLAPSDESNAGPVGRFWVGYGAMTLAPESTYEADVVSTELYDRIDAVGGVAVNGTLRVTAAPGFYPPPSFNFPLIRGKATGAFATVIGPAGFKTTMTYNNAGALARFEKLCGSDLNGDGLVDDADFALFCTGYDLMVCNDAGMPENCPADLDRDRVVDDRDFRVFVQSYAQMLCPAE